MRRLLSILGFACCLAAKAQMPNTELWLFKIGLNKLKQPVLTSSLNITRHNGYDNQPSFSHDGKKIYYTSVRDSISKQADIYCYDVKSKKTTQVTKSPTSEYSPVLSADGKYLSAVVVEQDSAQRIHFIDPVKGMDTLRLDIDSIGYYFFLNTDTVIYYKLTQPHSLRYYVKSSKEDKWLGNSPIRTFRVIDRHTCIYGLKDTAKVTFYKYDLLLHKAQKYTEYPSLNEDVVWHPAYGLIKSEGTQLLRFDEAKKEWTLLYDLAPFGLKKITRFAFDPNNNYLVVTDNL